VLEQKFYASTNKAYMLKHWRSYWQPVNHLETSEKYSNTQHCKLYV